MVSSCIPTLSAPNAFNATMAHQSLHGAFKTPTLRYLEQTGPYFHDGRFETLEQVIDYYQNPPESGPNGLNELRGLNLTDLEKQALAAFLRMFD